MHLPHFRFCRFCVTVGVLCAHGAARESILLPDNKTFTETFLHPRLVHALSSYMREPGMLLGLTRPAISMEVVTWSNGTTNETCTLDGTEALREWLYTQTVAVSERADSSAITMINAGLVDGTFLGYYDPQAYTFRASGDSLASEQIRAPHSSAEILSKTPECDLDAETDETAACPLGCASSGTACTGDAGTAYSLASCARSTVASCTPPTSTSAGCCHKDIRTYYNTSIQKRGAPQALTQWTTYDARNRTWYKEEMSRAGETGWSSVYDFSTSRALGVTRTAKLRRHDERIIGIAGIDFELERVSQILRDTLSGTASWAYIVERSGKHAGKLLGTSFSAPLRDADNGTRCDAASPAGSCNQNWPATASASASYLAEQQDAWETTRGHTLTNAVGARDNNAVKYDNNAVKYEAVATQFSPSGGLDWLLVVGQDIDCAGNERWVFGECKACPDGRVPSDDRSCRTCGELWPGTISDEGIAGGIGSKCVCPTGTYGHRSSDGVDEKQCIPCTQLDSRRSKLAGDDSVAWEQESVCPGGVVSDTTICPQKGLWITVQEPGTLDSDGDRHMSTHVDLLICPACKQSSCTNATTDTNTISQFSIAECQPHHRGFLCAECEENYKAIEGECARCDRIDWQWLFVEALSAVLLGAFLFYKSFSNSGCKPEDAEAVFNIIDSNKNGYLSGADIRNLLVRMGNPIAAGSGFDKTLASMKAKDIWAGVTLGSLRGALPQGCGGIKKPNIDWVERESVSKHEFIDWCRANQSRATMGTFVFAAQTFGLVAAHSSDSFSPAEIFNMDVGKAAKTCRLPGCGLFCQMMGMVVVPVFSALSLYLCVWYMATQVVPDQSLVALSGCGCSRRKDSTELKGLPIRWHHLQRGCLQLFSCTFAPVTRRCAELLFCRGVSFEGSVHYRLVADLSLECWVGRHLTAAIIASAVLIVYVLVIPGFLMGQAKKWVKNERATSDVRRPSRDVRRQTIKSRERARRQTICDPRSFLSSSSPQIKQWEERMDVSAEDLPKVLRRMHGTPTLNPKWEHELVKATRKTRYYWTFVIILLKTVVNIIFLVGQSKEYNWGMWLQVLLVMAALLSHFQRPYILKSDNRQEQMSFLGLAVVLSVTNSGIPYSGNIRWFHSAIIVFVVLLCTGSLCYIELTVLADKKKRKKRVKKGHAGMDRFFRQIFGRVCPTFLLLSEEDRAVIRDHVQVETFESGEIVYSEGDPANALFIVREGKVSLATARQQGQPRVVGEGESFGAGALRERELFTGAPASPAHNGQRMATATAIGDVVCLRLIRDDWQRVWAPITDSMAVKMFSNLDTDGSGSVARNDLEATLYAFSGQHKRRLASDPESLLMKKTVDTLLDLFDEDRDAHVTLAEFQRNLRVLPTTDDIDDAGSLPARREVGQLVPEPQSEPVERRRSRTPRNLHSAAHTVALASSLTRSTRDLPPLPVAQQRQEGLAYSESASPGSCLELLGQSYERKPGSRSVRSAMHTVMAATQSLSRTPPPLPTTQEAENMKAARRAQPVQSERDSRFDVFVQVSGAGAAAAELRSIQCRSNVTVKELRAQIAEATGWPAAEQRLELQGRELLALPGVNASEARFYGLQHRATVAVSRAGGEPGSMP